MAGRVELQEAAVDLQDVGGEPQQRSDRRVARPEVVDGHVYAQVAEVRELVAYALRLVEQHTLGDLQGERLRRQPRHGERPGHLVQQVAGEDLVAGDVDVDDELLVAGQLPPARTGGAGPLQHVR